MRHISDCIIGDVFYDNLKKKEFTIADRQETSIHFDNGNYLSYGDFPVPEGRYTCVKEFSPAFGVGDIVEDKYKNKGFVVQSGAMVSVQWMGNDYITHNYPENALTLFSRGPA